MIAFCRPFETRKEEFAQRRKDRKDRKDRKEVLSHFAIFAPLREKLLSAGSMLYWPITDDIDSPVWVAGGGR